MLRTVAGSASINASTGKGRYSRTLSRPTFSPRAASSSTASSAAPTPDPIITITRSASARSHVVDQAILATHQCRQLVHVLLHNRRDRVVVTDCRLPAPGRRRPGSGPCRESPDDPGFIARSTKLLNVLFVDHRRGCLRSLSTSILFTSCEERKPSKKWRNGTRASSVAAWATIARS